MGVLAFLGTRAVAVRLADAAEAIVALRSVRGVATLIVAVDGHLHDGALAGYGTHGAIEVACVSTTMLKRFSANSIDGFTSIPTYVTPKEFKILLALARMPDTVLSKEQLVEDAWGAEFVGETQSITVFIKKLRNKIEDDPSDPRIIETVWGIGYRLVEGAC